MTSSLSPHSECNQVENVDLIGSIARGEVLPEVESIFCNLSNLISTSQRPNDSQMRKFEKLFRQFMAPEVKKELKVFLNHIFLNPARQQPDAWNFTDFLFDQPLLLSQYHNHVTNRLSLYHCPTVISTEYLDVLCTFYHLRPNQNEQPVESDRVFGFLQFARLFPFLRKVKFDNRSIALSALNQKADADLFISFLSECLGLTNLELQMTGFTNGNFYDRLATLYSMATLTTLVVLEQPTVFRQRIDFKFLSSFIYLHEFSTNLVTKEMASDLIGMMRVCGDFRFQFCSQSLGNRFHQISVKRLDHSRYEISLGHEYLGSEFNRPISKHVCHGLNGAKQFLLAQLAIPHWLDE